MKSILFVINEHLVEKHTKFMKVASPEISVFFHEILVYYKKKNGRYDDETRHKRGEDITLGWNLKSLSFGGSVLNFVYTGWSAICPWPRNWCGSSVLG